MKFGVIYHKETGNLGDDIQTYAATRLLPRVDYFVDREHIDTFKTDNDEPVAVPMSAWWFWQKWNWPPAKCIVPLLFSMHINNYTIYNRGTPVRDRWLNGIGGEYLKNYGPVGVRDMSSLDFFKEHNIDAYFSGCVTLTLPKQPKTDDAGTYIVIADLNEKLRDIIMEKLKPLGIKVVEVTHDCKYKDSKDTPEERMKTVEKRLSLYQNAKCVITRRLHVSLPCLAMEVPVFSIVDLEQEGNATRWAPYSDWLHCVTNKDLKEGNFDYDFLNPPENKPTYKETREKLIQSVKDFVEKYENNEQTADELWKMSYTDQELMEWQNKLMKETLEDWLHASRGMMKKYNSAKAKLKGKTPSKKNQTPGDKLDAFIDKVKRKKAN